MSLLEQDIIRKGQVDEDTAESDTGDNESGEYKMEGIYDSVVYAKKSAGHLPGLYYLVFWKSYLEKKNT